MHSVIHVKPGARFGWLVALTDSSTLYPNEFSSKFSYRHECFIIYFILLQKTFHHENSNSVEFIMTNQINAETYFIFS